MEIGHLPSPPSSLGPGLAPGTQFFCYPHPTGGRVNTPFFLKTCIFERSTRSNRNRVPNPNRCGENSKIHFSKTHFLKYLPTNLRSRFAPNGWNVRIYMLHGCQFDSGKKNWIFDFSCPKYWKTHFFFVGILNFSPQRKKFAEIWTYHRAPYSMPHACRAKRSGSPTQRWKKWVNLIKKNSTKSIFMKFYSVRATDFEQSHSFWYVCVQFWKANLAVRKRNGYRNVYLRNTQNTCIFGRSLHQSN